VSIVPPSPPASPSPPQPSRLRSGCKDGSPQRRGGKHLRTQPARITAPRRCSSLRGPAHRRCRLQCSGVEAAVGARVGNAARGGALPVCTGEGWWCASGLYRGGGSARPVCTGEGGGGARPKAGRGATAAHFARRVAEGQWLQGQSHLARRVAEGVVAERGMQPRLPHPRPPPRSLPRPAARARCSPSGARGPGGGATLEPFSVLFGRIEAYSRVSTTRARALQGGTRGARLGHHGAARERAGLGAQKGPGRRARGRERKLCVAVDAELERVPCGRRWGHSRRARARGSGVGSGVQLQERLAM
jgi:hypothetical protein